MKAAFKGKMYEGPVDPLPKDRGIKIAGWLVAFLIVALVVYAGFWLPATFRAP